MRGFSRFLAGLLACAAAGGCAGPGADGLYRWESDAVQQQEAALLASPARIDDPRLQRYLDALVCRLDAGACGAVRVVVIDDAAAQVDLVGNRLLRVRRGVFGLTPDVDALAFVLAHELAHRRLGHVTARRAAGWDAARAEIAADADALQVLGAGGFDGNAGVRVLSAAMSAQPAIADAVRVRVRALQAVPVGAGRVDPERGAGFDAAVAAHFPTAD